MMKLRREKKDSLMSNSICPQGAWRVLPSAEETIRGGTCGIHSLKFNKRTLEEMDSRAGFAASLR
jgi:hypothetical protein